MAEPFPVSGNIDPKAFPFLLADLHRRGATGSLKVEGPSYPKALYFRAGRILFGSSNDPNDQLGAILIEQGKITPEQLDDVNSKVGPGNPLAKVLAESGYVNQRELGEAARIKVERILSDVIGYTSGSFEFEDGVLPKGAVDLKLSTEKLILSAVRRLADRAFALRHLESLAVVLAPTAPLEARLGELRAETADLPDRLDGQRTLKEAAALTHLEEFEAAKVACGLLFLGLVRRAEEGPEAAAAVAEGEEIDLSRPRLSFDESAAGETMAIPPPGGHSESESPFFTEGSAPSHPLFPAPEAEPTTAFAITPPPPPDFPLPDSAPFPKTEHLGFSIPSLEPPASVPAPSFVPSPAEPAPAFAASPASASVPAEPPPPRSAPTPSFPSFDEAPPEPVVATKPSKEDLAALDALLNPSVSRGPMQPLAPARSERWEPQFRPAGAPRRPSRKKRTSPLLVWGLALTMLLASGGGAAWYYFNLVQAPSTRQASGPRPVPSAPPTIAPPPPVSSASAAPALAASPEASPLSTPPPSALSTPTASPTPPTPSPTTPPPTTAAAPSQGDSRSAGEARGLLRKGSFTEAAQTFATNLKGTRGPGFSVQVLVACSTETIQKAVESVPADELFILPVNYKGKSCYRVCWGVYESEARASSALRSLPDYFRQGGATPKVASVASLLP